MILLSGFRPFLNQYWNPAQEVLENLSRRENTVPVLLPVEFNAAFEILRARIIEGESTRHPIKAVVMLGQAGGRSDVCLEKVALNYQQSFADEKGFCPPTGAIIAAAPAAYFTPFPVEIWAQELRSKKLPVQVSLTAGSFICNEIAFRMAHELQSKQSPTKWLFVHFPWMEKQVKKTWGGRAIPILSQSVMTTVVAEILNRIEQK